jgi:uncharacterized membrane protein
MPSYDALHPAVIHFPIALLLVTPVFLVLALVFRHHRTPYLYSALVLSLIGTAGILLAVSTGNAAEEIAEKTHPAAKNLMERHEELAESLIWLFGSLTAVLVLFSAGWNRIRSHWPRTGTAAIAALVIGYVGASTVLVLTARDGGRLVHEFGVHATTGTGTATAPSSAPATKHDD